MLAVPLQGLRSLGPDSHARLTVLDVRGLAPSKAFLYVQPCTMHELRRGPTGVTEVRRVLVTAAASHTLVAGRIIVVRATNVTKLDLLVGHLSCRVFASFADALRPTANVPSAESIFTAPPPAMPPPPPASPSATALKRKRDEDQNQGDSPTAHMGGVAEFRQLARATGSLTSSAAGSWLIQRVQHWTIDTCVSRSHGRLFGCSLGVAGEDVPRFPGVLYRWRVPGFAPRLFVTYQESLFELLVEQTLIARSNQEGYYFGLYSLGASEAYMIEEESTWVPFFTNADLCTVATPGSSSEDEVRARWHAQGIELLAVRQTLLVPAAAAPASDRPNDWLLGPVAWEEPERLRLPN